MDLLDICCVSSGRRQILSKVEGVAVITITGKKAIPDYLGELRCCEGFVRFSSSDISVRSHILYFKSSDGIDIDTLFSQLNSVTSPYVVRPLACGRGVGIFSNYFFLAVPLFSCSIMRYIHASSKNTIEKNRFTEEFIGVIGNVVHGILALHGQGFYCPHLEGKDILISDAGTGKTAQIWNFCSAGDDDVKSQDWRRLGLLIQAAARNQLISSKEINDLFSKINDKSLEGLQILKHSALLTVREKFENILALNMYILVHSKDQFQSASSAPGKSQAVTDLKNFTATTFNWVIKTPSWMKKRDGYREKNTDTGASSVDRLRDIIEHELDYILEKHNQTMKEIQELGRDPDLECEVRGAWGEVFLQAQNMVAKLDIQY